MPMPAPDWNNFFSTMRNYRQGEGGRPGDPTPPAPPPPAGQPPGFGGAPPPGGGYGQPPDDSLGKQAPGSSYYYMPQNQNPAGGGAGVGRQGGPPPNNQGPPSGNQHGPPATNQTFGGYTVAQLQADPSLVARLGQAGRAAWQQYQAGGAGSGHPPAGNNQHPPGNQGGAGELYGGYTAEQLTRDPSLVSRLGGPARARWNAYVKNHPPGGGGDASASNHPANTPPPPPGGPNQGQLPGQGGSPATAGMYDHQQSPDGAWIWDSIGGRWVPSHV